MCSFVWKKLRSLKFFRKGKLFLAVMAAAVVLTAVLAGCAKDETGEGSLRDLEFTVVCADEQPDALKEIIAEKSGKAFQISYCVGDDLFIAIGYGEQPSAGYSISVNAFYETEDALVIDTTLLGPGSAENVTDTPTTPYIVIKTENIADKPIEFQ